MTSLQHKLSNATDTTEVYVCGQLARTGFDVFVQDHGMLDSTSTLSQANANSFVAHDFWVELTETVAGLRSVLDDPEIGDGLGDGPDEIDSASPVSFATGDSSSSSQAPASADSHMILFGASVTAEPTKHAPTPKMKEYLLDVYKTRVDAIFQFCTGPQRYHLSKMTDPTILRHQIPAITR